VLIVMKQSNRTFVQKLDFVTSVGHADGGDARRRLGFSGKGPTAVITDLCIMRPDPVSRELTVAEMHPGVTREQIQAATGWPIR
jgi:glutaconate CoA-transferase subunit B